MRLLLATLACLAIAGCASHYTPESVADPYGFFSGIWHGIVFPWALLANVLSWVLGLLGLNFLDGVQLVGRPNTGFFFYYIGFIFGLSIYASAGSTD